MCLVLAGWDVEERVRFGLVLEGEPAGPSGGLDVQEGQRVKWRMSPVF